MLPVSCLRVRRRVGWLFLVLAVVLGVVLVQQVGHYAHEGAAVEPAGVAVDHPAATGVAIIADEDTPPVAPTGSGDDVAHWLAVVAVALAGLAVAAALACGTPGARQPVGAASAAWWSTTRTRWVGSVGMDVLAVSGVQRV
ncbi:hypothetical protein [Rhodococcus aerolatus]